VKFGFDFRPQSTLRRRVFQMEQRMGNLQHPSGAQMIDLRFDSDVSSINF